MSWFGNKKTEAASTGVKQLPTSERLAQFMLAADEAAKTITTSARYMRTSNFSLGEAGTPHTEYLEAIFMPAQESWKVQKIVLHEMLLPGSGVDKASAVSSIFPEADKLNYFEAIHRLAVFEQSQQALQPLAGDDIQHHYKDIAHNDQIAFNVYGMPGRTVDGRPVGKDTYAEDELALMQSLHGERVAAAEATRKNALPVTRVELPPPTLPTNLGALSEIFAVSAASSKTDPKRMAALIETQGALYQIRQCLKLGFGVWTGGKLAGSGPYAFRRSFNEAEFGRKYGSSGDDMNRWSLRGVAYAKYFRALKLAGHTAQQQVYAMADYPDLKKIMSESAIAVQSLLILWLAQTTRQEWDGQYGLNNDPNKKEIFGTSEEQGKIGTLTKEVGHLHGLIDREAMGLSKQEKETIEKSIPNLLRSITAKEFATPLNDVCNKLKAAEMQLRDYTNQTIEYAIQPPEELPALPAPAP